MSDNVPAVRTERQIAHADTDSWVAIIGEVAKFAQYVADTDFVPKSLRGNPAAVTAAIVYGRETGLGPMASLTQTYVVNGTPALSAKGKRGLVLAAGHEIETLESTGAICRMRSRRRGSERWSAEVLWTIDMARAAGLLGKDNWKNHPRQMLTARCSGELCDRDFPDVVLGFATAEDMFDEDGTAAAPAASGNTTKVGRKRTTRKAAAAPKGAQGGTPTPELAGPPLPGEPGFESPDGGGSAPESVEPPRPESEQADGSDESETLRGEAGDEDGNTEDPSADIVDGETVDEPADAHTVDGPGDEVAQEPAESPGEAGADEHPPASPPSPRGASRAQLRMLEASLSERGIDAKDREERHMVASKILGFEVESFSDLSSGNVSTLIDTLARTNSRADLWALLDAIDEGGQS